MEHLYEKLKCLDRKGKIFLKSYCTCFTMVLMLEQFLHIEIHRSFFSMSIHILVRLSSGSGLHHHHQIGLLDWLYSAHHRLSSQSATMGRCPLPHVSRKISVIIFVFGEYGLLIRLFSSAYALLSIFHDSSSNNYNLFT